MRRPVLADWRRATDSAETCAPADIIAYDGQRRVKVGRDVLCAAKGNHNS